ncbi:hypothetical protein [Clostridium sp.]|uniref:hypothetical protein n=1 Tax=Clostridium sp. TaxID=1506 RepID=UPI00321646DA
MKGLMGFKKVAVIEVNKTNNINYHYALYDENIKLGDKVLVTGCAAGKIVAIKEIISKEEAQEIFSKNISQEVICKVDLEPYKKRVEDRKCAAEILKKMDEKIKEMDEINKYIIYAEKNEDIKRMLEKYIELIN